MVDGSNLIKDGDKLATYKYQLTEFYIITDGETDKIPIERIAKFKIENHFENAVFPIFKLELLLEPSRYYNLLKNRDKVKFKVRVQMYYTTNDNPEEKSMLRDYINDTFVFFTDDDNRDQHDSLKKDEEKDINELDQLNNLVELFLFKDIVTKLRAPVNYVFSNINLCTAVCYLLNKAGVKKVLMSPFENTKTYGQLICPPLSTEAMIRYLNNNFGFHKKGSMLFFGFFHNYLLNCKEGCTAWYTKEWKESKIYILDKSNTKSHIAGSFIRKDEEIFYTLVSPDLIDIQNSSVSANVIGGLNPKVVDMKASSTNTSKVGASGIASDNTRIMFNDSSNPYMAETFAALQKANSTIISVIVDNINLEAFNPNKKHTITFENTELNSKYGGTYRIAQAIYSFQNAAGDFSIRATITFKKL